MGKIESQWLSSPSRRSAIRSLMTGFLAGSPLLRAQQDPYRDHSRVPALREMITPFDFEPVAYAKLPRDAYDYTALGVEDEFTLRRNRQAFEWVELIPRGIVDANSVSTATEVLGTKMAFPIMVAPTASHLSLHPEGEYGMHKGCSAASGTPMIISNNASLPLDKIGKAAAGPIWFQLYPKETLDDYREAIEIAQDAGCKAIAFTYDGASGASSTGPRERALHDRHLDSQRQVEDQKTSGDKFRATPRRPRRQPKYGLTGSTAGIDWKLVDSIRAMCKVPFLTKGILTGEDAKACVEHGLSGIIVSNHGGRAMDYGPATLEVLGEVVDGAQGRIPVLVDSGFRRGADVLKALALGAKAVCLGRVSRWGLAAYGPAGTQRILEIVQAELMLAMASTGRASLDSIDRSLVKADF
jgi:4-hydroxymandelate oxidase